MQNLNIKGEEMLPTVLIVEDTESELRLYQTQLEGKALMLSADNVKSAMELFSEHRAKIVLVVLDGHVKGEPSTTFELASWLRGQRFIGPMLATSANPGSNNRLVVAGCNYKPGKGEAVEKVLELLANLRT